MSDIKIELNSEGIQSLLKSPEIISCLQDVASGVATRSGGTVTGAYIGKTRANVSVYADNADNSLLKAMR